jgi:hypothetical protein
MVLMALFGPVMVKNDSIEVQILEITLVNVVEWNYEIVGITNEFLLSLLYL